MNQTNLSCRNFKLSTYQSKKLKCLIKKATNFYFSKVVNILTINLMATANFSKYL